MARLVDLTLTLGSERVSAIPGLMGVETSPLMTHESHARSNQRLCLATHIGTHVDAPYHFVPGRPRSTRCRWKNTWGQRFCWTCVRFSAAWSH